MITAEFVDDNRASCDAHLLPSSVQKHEEIDGMFNAANTTRNSNSAEKSHTVKAHSPDYKRMPNDFKEDNRGSAGPKHVVV